MNAFNVMHDKYFCVFALKNAKISVLCNPLNVKLGNLQSMFLVFCLVGRMNYLDDCVDDVGDAVRGLDISREDGGLGSIGIGESDGCSG